MLASEAGSSAARPGEAPDTTPGCGRPAGTSGACGCAEGGTTRKVAFDLHMHSTLSDGSHTMRELVDEAVAAGLSGIAITDHDCLLGMAAAREVADFAPIAVVGGMEISAADPETGRKVHILAFGLKTSADDSGRVERLVRPTLVARSACTLWQAEELQKAGYDVTPERVREVAFRSTSVYKQHVMEALCGLPYVDPAYQKLYRSLFKGDGIVRRDIAYPSCYDAVQAVHDDGGVAILAHPGQVGVFDLVPGLVEAGLAGIELMHPDNSEDDQLQARRLAARYELMLSGGSDYHGRYGKPSGVGCCGLTQAEASNELLDAIGMTAALRHVRERTQGCRAEK